VRYLFKFLFVLGFELLLVPKNNLAQHNAINNSEHITGITLSMHSLDYKNYSYQKSLKEIKATGASWVCLNFKFYQDTINSTKIEIQQDDSAYWMRLDSTIIQAKNLGFKVAILPIVLLKKSKPKEWRGKIKPTNLNSWFFSYKEMLGSIINNVAIDKVDLFFIGSEFSSLQKKEKYWVDLINSIRMQYNGLLTYSVNWDALTTVSFANNLDLLGITGYFSLTNQNNPSYKKLVKSWEGIKQQIQQSLSRYKVPYFFSELGYTSQNGINTNPWNYYISEEIDLNEQKQCFEAFTKVWKNEPDLKGVFFYEWFNNGGVCDLGYNPKDKPALKVIKTWF